MEPSNWRAVRTAPKFSSRTIRIQFLSDYPEFISGVEVAVKQDGSFTVNSLVPVPWHVRVYGAPVFIKSVLLRDQRSERTYARSVERLAGRTENRTQRKYRNHSWNGGAGNDCRVSQCGRPVPIGAASISGSERTVQNCGSDARKIPLGGGRIVRPIPKDGGIEITVQEGETASVDLPPR